MRNTYSCSISAFRDVRTAYRRLAVAGFALLMTSALTGACSDSTNNSRATPLGLPAEFHLTSSAATVALSQVQATVAANAAFDSQMNCLVRVFLDDGNMVQICEPAPGHILFVALSVGGMPLGQRIPGYTKMSATDLFSALVPNTAVPAVLTAAQQRAAALPAQHVIASAPSPASAPSAGPALKTQSVRPLDCGTCTNWCDYSCWACRACGSGDSFDWCYADAYNGAWANDNGNDDEGWANICSVQGNATLTTQSDVYNGNYTVGPQQGVTEWTQQNSYCFPVQACDENILFSVSGSGIDVRFGGWFNDTD